MARVSREQADRNRAAIEQASARLFREQGLNGVSVPQLMAAAGLTHGAFYGHFESKDALAAIACEQAFIESAMRREKRMAGHDNKRAARKVLTDNYLTCRHRDDAGQGCPAAALAGDVAREPADKPVHVAYLDGVKQMIDAFALLSEAGSGKARRKEALVQVAALVGAMTFARATRGDPISDDILAEVRGFLAAFPPAQADGAP